MELPTVMQNIGLAILTIFIPLGLYLYESRDEDYKLLDSAVILDQLIDGKRLIFKFFLLFAPLLFWDIQNYELRIVIILSWLVGVLLTLKVLASVYDWVRGNKFKYRFQFLERFQSSPEIEEIWKSIWKIDSINLDKETRFLQIFTSYIDNLLAEKSKESVNEASKLLNDFRLYVDKKNLVVLGYGENIVQKILEWDLFAWKEEYHYLVHKNEDPQLLNFGSYSALSITLQILLKIVFEKGLMESFPFMFFSVFTKHIEQNEKVHVTGENNIKYFYLYSILPVFLRIFFEKIHDSPLRYDIWDHYFPEPWKVSTKNISSLEHGIIIEIVVHVYIDWSRDRLYADEYDLKLDNVTSNLFPDTDPRTFALLLSLLIRSWNSNRIGDLIECNMVFGVSSRISGVYDVEDWSEIERRNRERQERERIESVDLFYSLFKNAFREADLIAWISFLKMNHYEDLTKEYRREELLFALESYLDLFQKDRGIKE